jgi:hypothetical protein
VRLREQAQDEQPILEARAGRALLVDRPLAQDEEHSVEMGRVERGPSERLVRGVQRVERAGEEPEVRRRPALALVHDFQRRGAIRIGGGDYVAQA